MNLMQLPGPLQNQDRTALSPVAELVRLILQNKWKIAGLAIACSIIGALYAYTRQPQYRAIATVLLEARPDKPVQLQEAYDPGIGTDNYLMTQVGILRSRALAGKVVDRLKLTENPEFVGHAKDVVGGYWREQISGANLRSWLPFMPAESAGKQASDLPPDPAQLKEIAVDRFLGKVTPFPLPRTQLIQIYFTSNTPEMAAQGANALANAYIEYGLEARLEASKKATDWINEKMADILKNLQESEKNLQKFREQQQVVNVGGIKGLLGEEVLDNSRRLRESQKRRTELSSTYAKIQEAGTNIRMLEQIGDLMRVPLVNSAKGNLLNALEGLKQLQQRYGEKHPMLGSALTRVEAAERTFRDQLLLAAQNVRTEYEIARENERVLSATVEAQKGQIRNLDRREYELGLLEREVSSNKQLYDMFLSNFKSNETASSYEPINVRLLEPAIPPGMRFEPVISRYAMNGLIIGLVLGIGLILLRHLLDETVHSPEDLENLTGVPVISVIPRVSTVLGSRKSLPQMFAENPRTPFAEGIRSIRASLKLNDVDKSYKRILVTSAVPGEGKSSLASCIAMAFGSGEKTLLVDADLRAPTVKRMFDLPKDRPGIMELLTGEATLENCLYLHEASQIYVLPVAKSPANPAEVINSAAFAKLIASLSERFDHVILDSPPCQAASDSLVLAKMADVVLFTTRAEATHRRAVANAIKQLRQVQAHLVGSVLNQVDTHKNSYYADTYYYTRKYYG